MDSKRDKKQSKQNEENYPSQLLEYCWNCGSKLTSDEWCDDCKVPIKEDVKLEVLSRTSSDESIRCWRCKGTTSGDICGICGSPITKQGVELLKEAVKTQVFEQIPLEEEFVFILSPKDRQVIKTNVRFFKLEAIVQKHFQVVNAALTNFGPEIIVHMPENLEVFDSFENESLLIENYLRPIIRKTKLSSDSKKYAIMRFFYWIPEDTTKRFAFNKIRWKLLLLLLTFCTIFLSSWLYYREIYAVITINKNIFVDVSIFTFILLAIIFTHELGHVLIQRLRKIKLSLPFFIPLPPTPGLLSYFMLGSAGGFIRVINPLRKRNDLFDLFLLGPVFGLTLSIGIYIGGIALPYIQDKSSLTTETLERIEQMQNFDPFLLMGWFLDWFGTNTDISPSFNPETQVKFLHPLAYAGLVGIILNGINFLPGSILDGGFMLGSLVNEKVSRVFSFISALLIMLNYNTWTLGILTMFVPLNVYQTPITNEAVPVHWTRYIIEAFAILIAISCLPLTIFFFISNN